MNSAQMISSVVTAIMLLAGGFITKLGFNPSQISTDIEELIALAIAIFTWWKAHQYHSTPAANARAASVCKIATRISIFLALAVLATGITGCSTVYTNGCVTTIQNRFLGIQVTATSSTTGTPSVLFGAGSSLVTVYPTSSNLLYCAPFFSTASGNTTANPFDVTINETIGAGNVAAAINTNGSSSSTIIPKLSRPPAIPVSPTPPTPPTPPTK